MTGPEVSSYQSLSPNISNHAHFVEQSRTGSDQSLSVSAMNNGDHREAPYQIPSRDDHDRRPSPCRLRRRPGYPRSRQVSFVPPGRRELFPETIDRSHSWLLNNSCPRRNRSSSRQSHSKQRPRMYGPRKMSGKASINDVSIFKLGLRCRMVFVSTVTVVAILRRPMAVDGTIWQVLARASKPFSLRDGLKSDLGRHMCQPRSSRSVTSSEDKAIALDAAITETPNGVMEWIRAHW